jgi:hypothetical protein
MFTHLASLFSSVRYFAFHGTDYHWDAVHTSVFASSLNFAELEAEKNMSSGENLLSSNLECRYIDFL